MDAVHVQDISLLAAADEAILRAAREQNRVVFTLDHDFHQILALGGESSPSVVFLRFEHLSAAETFRVVAAVVRTQEQELEKGVMLSVSPGSVRVRNLPLRRPE